MELTKTRYKKTEVGLIPEDWSCERIDQFAKITTGGKDTQDRVDDGVYPFYVRSNVIERINSYSFDGEAVLTSGDGVGVGKIFHYLNEKFDYHQRVYNIYNFREDVFGKYFYFFFSTHFYNRVMAMTAKSSVDSVRREMIADMLVPLPPTLEEQKAIATALSDVDDLINNLEKLIAKKKAIKQGAMQQLLEPKKDWNVKKLGDLGFDISDGNYSSKYPSSSEFKQVGIPFIRANNIKKNTVIDNDMRYISKKLHGELLKGHLKKGDILITTRGEIGQIAIVPDSFIDANINAQIVRINTNDKLNNYYFAYFLMKSESQATLFNFQTGSALKQLPVGKLTQLKVFFPNREEQNLISQILKDMDSEIFDLDSKKEKYQNIKQGMMQELLTGKTRLV
jgi:type I restriction enzyme S subunit